MRDIELIHQYLEHGNQVAFSQLLDRHLKVSQLTVRKMCQDQSAHDDLVQQAWVKILQSLSQYQDQGKFAAFVTRITQNTVRDYWRNQGVRADTEAVADAEGFERFAETSAADTGIHEARESLKLLLHEFIPALPEPLRVVFLLKHEAEYWDNKQRLDWDTLGVLTDQSSVQAWQRFSLARRILMSTYDGDDSQRGQLGERDWETFLLWTQAHRPIEQKRVTETDLAALLGIPLNTFKTRYRAAKKSLREKLVGVTDEQLSA